MTSIQTTDGAIDWADVWKKLQKPRRRPDNAEFWDKRSKTFGTADSPTAYVEAFLEKAALKPGESVLDMGCGTGALTIPLAREGHPVVAADFSAGMLGVLDKSLKRDGITGVKTVQMSWEDDWGAFGVTPKSADVCIASRSIAVADLGDALAKLTAVARRRICVTVAASVSPRIDGQAMQAIGLTGIGRAALTDLQFVFGILTDRGYRPEVSYINGSRRTTFDTFDEAFEQYRGMISIADPNISDTARATAETNLRGWLQEHLVDNPEAGKPDGKGRTQGALVADTPRKTSWAFISWDVD